VTLGGNAGAVEAMDEAPPRARMAIAVLALLGVLDAGYLSLYKLHVIGELQCQVGSCEQVQASPWADVMGIPVSVLGLGAYVAILALALLGVQPGQERRRWIGPAICAIAAVGVVYSAYLTYVEAVVIQMWCQYCVVSAVLITLIFLLSIPGALGARRAGA
jgi:uncharacterized membrane protein